MRLIIARTNGDSTLDFEVNDVRWLQLGKNRALGWSRPGNRHGIAFTEEYITQRFTAIYAIEARTNMHWRIL